MYRITEDQFQTLVRAIGSNALVIKEILNQQTTGYPLPADPFPIRVLVEPGVTVPLASLSAKDQRDVERQIKMVSEVAELEIREDDEL